MKKLAILLLSILTLSACSSSNQPAQNTDTIQTTDSVTSEPKFDAEALEKEQEEQKLKTLELESDYTISGEAANESNLKKCDEIKDQNIKSSCRYNVVIAQMTQTKDPNKCDLLDNEYEQERCREIAQQFVE